MPEQKFDLDFIMLSFGLIPIMTTDGPVAINPSSITNMEWDNDAYKINIHNGPEYTLTPTWMAELEQTIKARSEDMKILQREAFKSQMTMQNEVAQEIQRGVVGAQLINAGKRKH